MKLLAVLTSALLLVSCSKNIQTNEAVHQSVMDYLNAKAQQTGLDMSAMQVDVASVSFEKDVAHATISIRPKNIQASPMQIAYVLDRKGDKWVVRGPASGSNNPHQGADSSALPGGHPTVEPGAAPSSTTPPSGNLPPGHPPIGKSQ